MSERRIKVTAYSGHRGEESPWAFIENGEKIEVLEILDRWIEEKVGDRSTKRFFKVKGNDASVHKIYYDEKVKQWFYNEG